MLGSWLPATSTTLSGLLLWVSVARYFLDLGLVKGHTKTEMQHIIFVTVKLHLYCHVAN